MSQGLSLLAYVDFRLCLFLVPALYSVFSKQDLMNFLSYKTDLSEFF